MLSLHGSKKMKNLADYVNKFVEITDADGGKEKGLVYAYTSPLDADEDEGEEENIAVLLDNKKMYEYPASYIKDIKVLKR